MILPKEYPEREALEGIATDFRQRGYDVVIEPRGAALPEFLAGTTPDMIATKDNEHVVVEVKSAPDRVDPEQVRQLANRISRRAGWRFVLMAPKPREQLLPGEDLRPLDDDSIRRRFDEARKLVSSGHVEAALLLAWTAAEATMRLLSEPSPDRPDTRSLLRRLASEGVLDQGTFAALNEAYRLRSSVAHGLTPVRGDVRGQIAAAVESLFVTSQSLLGDRRKSA